MYVWSHKPHSEATQGVDFDARLGTIRLRCVRDKEPIKRVARELGCSPNTIRKYIRSQAPPTKIKLSRDAKLDRYRGVVDELLKNTPKITAKRIGDILRKDYDSAFSMCESAIRRYVAKRKTLIVPKEAFIRAEYLPGRNAQFDFSPMRAVIGGKEKMLEVFVMRLSYSGHMFARASEREDLPALMNGIIKALEFFGGLPYVAVFDNAKTAVTAIGRGRERTENECFRAFRGNFALEVQYAAPCRGNEKGGVEGAHGFIEDNFFRPAPHADSLDQLNQQLEQFCMQQLKRVHSTHKEEIGVRFDREKTCLRPLPDHFPDACVTNFAKINKFSEIVVKTNRYSVPDKYAFRDAFVEMWDDRICIRVGKEPVAIHRRLAGRRQSSIDPMHYLDTLSKKHRAAMTAVAFGAERIPAVFLNLREILLQRDGERATKQWMQILCLAKDSSLERVARAVSIALARGVLDYDAISLLVRQEPDLVPKLESRTANILKNIDPVTLDQYSMNILTENI
jgi:transposase